MKRASILLLSHLTRQKPKTLTPLLSRNYLSSNTTNTPSYYSLHSPTNNLKSCTKTNGLIIKPHQSQSNPSRNSGTLVETTPQISSRQKKIKERSQIEEAFESAATVEGMLEAFKDMEACFDERELGLALLKVGL
jgi:hypothetical protein